MYQDSNQAKKMCGFCRSLILMCVVASIVQFTETTSITQKINDYLDVNTVKDNLESYKATALQMLGEQEQIQHPSFSRGIQEELKAFISLIHIQGKEICNFKSYDVVMYFDDFAREITRVRKEPIRLYDKIINYCLTNHAKECQAHYVIQFRSKYLVLDQAIVSQVEIFTDELMISDTTQGETSSTKQLMNHITSRSHSTVDSRAQGVYNALKILTRADSTGVINKNEIKNLFFRYVYEPCLYYVKNLISVFAPAYPDISLLHDIGKLDLLENENRDFFTAFARFKICQNIVDKESAKLVEKVIKYARKIHD